MSLGIPYAQGSDTSLAAAVSMKRSAASIREDILQIVKVAGREGVTCDETETMMCLSHQTVSARFTELKRDELVFDSGQRRLTRSAREAAVYVAVKPVTP